VAHDIGLYFLRFVGLLQTDLYIYLVQPLLYHLHLMDYDEDTYDALYWSVVGVLEIVITYIILRPLEAWRPVEHWQDRKPLRSDVWYTWIAKIGVLNALFFMPMQPVINHIETWMTVRNIWALNIDEIWPGVTDEPLVSFVIYLVVLDFLGYWYHRWQHRFGLWWELHAVHHSQRQMSLWNDDRNHFLDDIVQTAFFTFVGLFIGVQPGQFVILVALGNTLQAIQHVNARLSYGRLLERIIVSPSFHRRHHAMEYGHTGIAYGCNFGVLVPWWDMMFRTASWENTVEPTGISDQLSSSAHAGREYGRGVWMQEWLALCRIGARISPSFEKDFISKMTRSH